MHRLTLGAAAPMRDPGLTAGPPDGKATLKKTQTGRREGMEGVVRVGGQALPDGVVMRTGRAWAVARADGSVESGELPPPRMAGVPVLRVVVGLVVGLQVGLGLGRSKRRRTTSNWPFLRGLLVTEAVVLVLDAAAGHLHAPRAAAPVIAAALCVAALGVFRLVAPAAQWRYHGAEHKAVTAHEASADITDPAVVLGYSRVHARCGTNLVMWAALLAPIAQRLPLIGQLLVLPLLLGVVAEVISLAARHPAKMVSRVLLAPGMVLQALITTAEPSLEEQRVGCMALTACLARHETVTEAAGLH
jgi:uncharacterized protein YqhQ